jgi:hypothetical protein
VAGTGRSGRRGGRAGLQGLVRGVIAVLGTPHPSGGEAFAGPERYRLRREGF